MKRELVIINISGPEPAKNILKAELVRAGVSHQQLADLLTEASKAADVNGVGEVITKASVDNKLARGNFSADFFLQSLKVLHCEGCAYE